VQYPQAVEEGPAEDDYQPAPWQRAAPGVLQRADYEPMSGPAWPVAPPPTSATAPPLPIEGAPRRRRSPMIAVLVIVIVAVLGGGVAAAVAFLAASPDDAAQPQATAGAPEPPAGGGSGPAAGTASPKGGSTPPGNAKAPADVKVQDNKTSVTLTWRDPSHGAVPFIVAGGQQGAMRQLQALAAGTTKYTINGLNPKLNYCFTVAAVYGTDDVQLSELSCTNRS
jgi:hypothetical protein